MLKEVEQSVGRQERYLGGPREVDPNVRALNIRTKYRSVTPPATGKYFTLLFTTGLNCTEMSQIELYTLCPVRSFRKSKCFRLPKLGNRTRREILASRRRFGGHAK
jgi:hypothetical protein